MGQAWRSRFVGVMLVVAGVAAVAPAVAVAQTPPSLLIGFSPNTIPLGGTSTLRFDVTNPDSSFPETAVTFTDTLPAGLVVAQAPNPTNSCADGITSTTAGSQTIQWSDAAIPPSTTCTISVDVTGTQIGQPNNSVQASSDQGASNTASAFIDVVPDAPPTLSAAFSPGDTRPSGASQLTFTIGNPAANPIDATNVSFTDTLPGGLTVATGSSSVCNGTLSTTSPDSISFTGGSVAPSQQCAIPVTVAAGSTDGQLSTTTSAVSSDQDGGNSGPGATATLTVASPPTISAAFGTTRLGLNGTTPLTFTLTNPNQNVTLTGIAFSDSLPTGLAFTGSAGNTCQSGVVAAGAGSSSIVLSGAQLPPGASCTVTENVTATATGILSTTTGPAGSTEGGAGNAASANLTIIGAPIVSVSSPLGGQVYAFGQQVRASYSCADDPNGPGVRSCAGDVANGALIDTSKAGAHLFTVTAISQDGGMASDTVFYTVAPNNQVKVRHVRVRPDGTIYFTIGVPGPGRIDVREMASKAKTATDAARRRHRHGRFAFGHRRILIGRAHTVRFRVSPTARGRHALAAGQRLEVIISLTYTPRGGAARTISFGLGI